MKLVQREEEATRGHEQRLPAHPPWTEILELISKACWCELGLPQKRTVRRVQTVH